MSTKGLKKTFHQQAMAPESAYYRLIFTVVILMRYYLGLYWCWWSHGFQIRSLWFYLFFFCFPIHAPYLWHFLGQAMDIFECVVSVFRFKPFPNLQNWNGKKKLLGALIGFHLIKKSEGLYVYATTSNLLTFFFWISRWKKQSTDF